MNRYKAAGLHFLGSAAVLLLIAAVVRWVWYPGPFFYVAGGVNLIGIIAGVDVVLGPLIMLIIFNPQKKSIKFDVACVLVFQLAFLGYGVWSIGQARPAFITFAGQRFFMVTANEIEEAELKKGSDDYFSTLAFTGPRLVGTQGPSDPKKAEDIDLASSGGMGIQNLPQYYVSYSKVQAQVKQAAKPASAINKLSEKERKFLQDYEAANQARKIGFVPLTGKGRLMFAVVDSESGALLEILLPQ